MADAITVIAGTLEDSIVTPPNVEHYHPDVSATLSIQGFVPVASVPRTIIVRARQASSVPASITCRMFDSVGNPVFIETPIVDVSVSSPNFANFAFSVAGSSVYTFPALSIYTVELEFSRVDLCGILICYKPSFPMVCEGNATAPNCLTTTVIS